MLLKCCKGQNTYYEAIAAFDMKQRILFKMQFGHSKQQETHNAKWYYCLKIQMKDFSGFSGTLKNVSTVL